MAKLPRLTAKDAEKLLFEVGFMLARSKGSHRIYMKGIKRVIIPFHSNIILHPKIVKQLLKTINQKD